MDESIDNTYSQEQILQGPNVHLRPSGICDPLIDKPSTDQNTNILPESESPGRKYDCESDLSPRPSREKVRGQIADYVLLMLGAPVIDIELDIQQVSLAVDEALKVFEEWAPAEFFQYYSFPTVARQSTYTMPCDVGLIRQVYYNPPSCDGASQLGGGQTLGWIGDTGYGAGGLAWGAWGYNRNQPYWSYGGEWLLFKQYEETFERLSSRNPGWEFVQDGHHIKLYPTPELGGATVTVHYLQKKKDWTSVHEWMRDYALALAKIMLGRIRSKFSSIVSPSGGITLDGQNLLAEGNQEKKDLEKDLITKWNEPIAIIMG